MKEWIERALSHFHQLTPARYSAVSSQAPDFFLIPLLAVMSASVYVLDQRIGLTFAIVPVCALIGILHGRKYAGHIAVGTLPLLLGVTLVNSDSAGVGFSFAGSDIFFANLMIFHFLTSQRFRRRVLSAKSIAPHTYLIIFIGLSFFIFRDGMADQIRDAGLSDRDKESFWFGLTGLVVDEVSFPVRQFLIACFLMLGFSRVRYSGVALTLAVSWLLAAAFAAVRFDPESIGEVVLGAVAKPTYSSTAFFFDCLVAFALGRFIVQNRHFTIRNPFRSAWLLLALLPIAIILTGVRVDLFHRFSSEDLLVFSNEGSDTLVVSVSDAGDFYVDRIISWAHEGQRSVVLPSNSSDGDDDSDGQAFAFPKEPRAVSFMSIEDFVRSEERLISYNDYLLSPVSVALLLFAIGYVGGFWLSLVASLLSLLVVVSSAMFLSISGALGPYISNYTLINISGMTLELLPARPLMPFTTSIGGVADAIAPDFLVALLGAVFSSHREFRKTAGKSTSGSFFLSQANGTTVTFVCLGAIFVAFAMLEIISVFAFWMVATFF